MAVTQRTDDLDMNGHHLRDWRYLGDIPQGGAVVGQALVWNGKSWAPATVTGSGGPVVPDLVSSVFGRVGDVVGTNQDYTSIEDWAAVSVLLKNGITLNSALEVLQPGDIHPGFKVLDSSGLLHVLQYDETNNSWTLDGPLIIGEAGSGTDVVQIGASTAVAGTLNLGQDSIKTNLSAGFTFSRKIQVNGTVTGVSGFVGDTVSERTNASGVTVDGVLLKDNEVYTNVVKEGTAGSGVTADGVLLKDFGVTATWSTVGASRVNLTSSMALTTVGSEFGTTYTGLTVPVTVNAAAGTVCLATYTLLNLSLTVTNSTPTLFQPFLNVISSTVNAGALNISLPSGPAQPVHFIFSNPGPAQAFSEGYFSVDVSGTSGTVVAAYTRARVSGSAIGIGYLGYAIDASGSTGNITGVNGYVVISTGSTSTFATSFDATVSGSAITYDKRMSFRGSNHVLIRGGSLILATGTPVTPGAVSTTHLTLTAGGSDLFVGGKAEVDGEMFMDGNTSLSVATPTAASYNAGTATVILADATSNAITVNLPAASGKAGRIYTIKKIDASGNAVTVDGNSAETIDGAATYVLSAQYDVVRIVCNGSNWFVI